MIIEVGRQYTDPKRDIENIDYGKTVLQTWQIQANRYKDSRITMNSQL
jgi:hypothetical protein